MTNSKASHIAVCKCSEKNHRIRYNYYCVGFLYYHTDIGYVIGGDMLTSTIRQVSKWQNISRQNLSSK
ncbi:MAG: hypothetical protein ACR5LD_09575, partial [Symbiopectobacterium sp.]